MLLYRIPLKRFRRIWLLPLLPLLWLQPSPAFSQGNIHLGNLEIHPSLLLTESFDDNVYATSSNTLSDWITTTTPGLKLEMPYRSHQFGASYRADIYNYFNYTSEDICDQFANAHADFKFAGRFGLKFRDDYAHGHEDRATSASGDIVKYDKNAANADLSYVFADRVKLEAAYTLTTWDFSDAANQYRNRTENLIATYLYYRFMPRTAAFVEYDFKNVDFEQKQRGLDNTVQTPFLGLRWDISDSTRGTVKAGYLYKEFETSRNGSFGTFTASAEVDQAFTERSLLRLVGLRDVNESSLQGSTYTTTTGVLAEYTHKMAYRISAVLRGFYGEDDYSGGTGAEADRNDLTLRGGAGLKYQMRDWLEFSLFYTHVDRNSNISKDDLNDNIAAFGVNITL